METKFKGKPLISDTIFDELKAAINGKKNVPEALNRIIIMIKQKKLFPSKLIRFLKGNLKNDFIKLISKSDYDLILRPLLSFYTKEKFGEDELNFLKVFHFFSFDECEDAKEIFNEYIEFLIKSIENEVKVKQQILANLLNIIDSKNTIAISHKLVIAKALYSIWKVESDDKRKETQNLLILNSLLRCLNGCCNKFSEFLNESELNALFFSAYRYLFVQTTFGSSIRIEEIDDEVNLSSGLSDASYKDQTQSKSGILIEKLKCNSILFLQALILAKKTELNSVWNHILKCDSIKSDYISLIAVSKNSEKTIDTMEIQKLFHSPVLNFIILNENSIKIIGNLCNLIVNILDILPIKLLIPLNPEKIEQKKSESTFISQSFFLYHCLKNLVVCMMISMNRSKNEIYISHLLSLLNTLISKRFLIKLPIELRIALIGNLIEKRESDYPQNIKLIALSAIGNMIENEENSDILSLTSKLPGKISLELFEVLNFQTKQLIKSDLITLELINFIANVFNSLFREFTFEIQEQISQSFSIIISNYEASSSDIINIRRFTVVLKCLEKIFKQISIEGESSDPIISKSLIQVLSNALKYIIEKPENDIIPFGLNLISILNTSTFNSCFENWNDLLHGIISLENCIPKSCFTSYFSALGSLSLLNMDFNETHTRQIIELLNRHSQSTTNANVFTRLSWAHSNWIAKICREPDLYYEIISQSTNSIFKYIECPREKVISNGIRALGIVLSSIPLDQSLIEKSKSILLENLKSNFPKVLWNSCVSITSIINSDRNSISSTKIAFASKDVLDELLHLFISTKIVKTICHCCLTFSSFLENTLEPEIYCYGLLDAIEIVQRETKEFLIDYEDFKLHKKLKIELGFLLLKILKILFSSADKLKIDFIDKFNRNSIRYFSIISFSLFQYTKMESEKEITLEEEEEEKIKENKNQLIGNIDDIFVKGGDGCITRIIDLKSMDSDVSIKIKRQLEDLKEISNSLSIFIDSNSKSCIPFFLYDLINDYKCLEISDKISIKLMSE